MFMSLLGVISKKGVMMDRLKELREARGDTQRTISYEIGITEAYLGLLESGKQDNPSRKILEAFADYYDVSVDYILGRESKVTP